MNELQLRKCQVWTYKVHAATLAAKAAADWRGVMVRAQLSSSEEQLKEVEAEARAAVSAAVVRAVSAAAAARKRSERHVQGRRGS